jgi:tripartite-type tricarboxylate transporter receptor subunit TctC
MQQRWFVASLLLLSALAATTSSAQQWPSRPVRLIVPVAPGGSTDVTARLIAEHMGRVFGTQFIVDNRTGAGGTAGMEAVAKSAPDGYNILVTTDRIASAPYAFKLSFDPIKDLAAVVNVTRQPVVLAVHPSLGVSTLAELIALAKRRPAMSYATSGIGIHQHFVGEWFQHLAGIKLTMIPYRGGGQIINDLLAGHVQIAAVGSTPLIPHAKVGSIRLLAQSTAARSPGVLDVPTFEEAGMKGLVLDQWIGVFVPKAVPPPIVTRLNAEINKVLADPSIRNHLNEQALEPVGGSTEEAERLLKGDFEKYGRLIRELNIKLE